MSQAKFESYKRATLIALGVFLFSGVAASIVYVIDERAKRFAFEAEHTRQAEVVKNDVERALDITFDTIRTIAALPFIRNLSTSHLRITKQEAEVVQEMYNTLYTHFKVSEIYIVDANFDADHGAPEYRTPIISFDSNISRMNKANEDIEEIEIYEYREIKKQIDFYKEKIPIASKAPSGHGELLNHEEAHAAAHATAHATKNGLTTIAMSSKEVITCDNSHMTQPDLKEKNDRPRMGWVYTVPYYSASGHFSGVVTAIIRSEALLYWVKYPHAEIRSDALVFNELPRSDEDIISWSSKIDIYDQSSWFMNVRVPRAIYEVTDGYKNAVRTGWISWGIGTLLSVLTFFIYISRSKMNRRLDRAEKEKVLLQKEINDFWEAISVSNIIGVTDALGRITNVNENFCKVSGYTSFELLGKDHRLLNSGLHDKEFFKKMWQQIKSGRVWQGEICNRKKDGTLYWVNTVICPVKNKSGEVIGYISVRTDITEQKTTQLKMVQSARLSSLGEMASGIAHEINNPLTVIQGKTLQLRGYVRDRDFAPEKFNAGLDKIFSSTERISRIIRGMRSATRDGSKDQFEKVPLKSIVDEVISLCSERYQSKGVRLDVAVPPDITIEARSVQISQVLINLLNNAFDATFGLNQKWVRMDFETLPGNGNSHETGDWVRISVTDSGSGIPKEVAARLMEPFFTTKGVSHGTGLGLSISKNMIEAHSGRFYLDSSSPNTRFVMEIPIQRGQNQVA